MKLVSPKTLLASLLGCTFVVMKVMTFDGLVDMFWIIFIGYLTVKAIVTAFSQEAYDEDIRQAQQGKVLYRDLFGKFAYIAADVPILLILLAGLLASVCSATTLLRATLIGLLLIAVGYAIWFSWYVSKHKRLRMKNGEWGTGILSTEDEKAWKRSNLWHGIILGITGCIAKADDPFQALKETLDALPDETMKKRVRHVVTEIERVRSFVRAFASGDIEAAGRLFNASHDSLAADYEVTVPELDVAVDVARKNGAYGARMTGGGFGGSIIALVDKGRSQEVAQKIADEFEKQGFHAPRALAAYAAKSASREA